MSVNLVEGTPIAPAAPQQEPAASNSSSEPSMAEVLSEIRMVNREDAAPPPVESGDDHSDAMNLLRDKSSSAVKEPEKPSLQQAEPRDLLPNKHEAYVQNVVRQKAQLLQEQRKTKEQQRQNQELINQGKRFQDLMRLKDENPMAFMDQVKLEPDAVVRKMVQEAEEERSLTPHELQAKVLSKVNEELNKREEQHRQKQDLEAKERHKQAYIQESISLYQQNIMQTVQSKPKEFELIGKFGRQSQVWKETLNFYQKFGAVPPAEVVCEVVEKSLRDEVKRISQTDYFQDLLADLGVSAKANNRSSDMSASHSSKSITLTNSVGKGSAEILNDDLDEQQAKEEALKYIRFKD